MRLSQALELYKDQWIAFRMANDGDDPDGDVVVHDANRDAFRRRLKDGQVKSVYITFSAEPIAEGYVAMF